MIKKHLLHKVLDVYFVNANEVINQISIREFLSGKLTLRNLTLKADTIQDLYGSMLPPSTEVLNCHVDELKLAVPWISLNSTPCAVEVTEGSLQLRLRCPATSAKARDAEEVRFWQQQGERLASAVEAFDHHCESGAQKPALLQRVLGALSVQVKRLRLELWRSGGRSPTVLGTIEGVRFKPTTADWQPPKHINQTSLEVPGMFEVRNFVVIEIDSVAIETACGGARAHLGPLAIKTISKSPALQPQHAPTPCTVHRTIDIGPLNITGSEDALTVLLGAVNDIQASFCMTDDVGLMVQRYMPSLDSAEEEDDVPMPMPMRKKEELIQMRRRTTLAFESLVSDSRRASLAASAEGERALDQIREKAALAEIAEDGFESPGDSDDEEDEADSFEDAHSECSDGPVDVVETSSSMLAGQRPKGAPVAAVVRKTVTLASAELRVTLAAGELVIRLGQLDFLADGVRPLSLAAQKCCADLFEVPMSTQAPSLGNILMDLKLHGVEVSFNSHGGQANGRSPRARRVRISTPSNIEAGLIARLTEQDRPPLTLSKRGTGAPVPCGEVQAEPMELLVSGLTVQVGKGFDELRAWWDRLSPSLLQLDDPPPPAVPSSCMMVQLLQTTVQQEPTDPSHLTVSGSWPKQITLPMLEVKSTSSMAELPATVGAFLSTTEEFQARSWWQPLFVVSSQPRRSHSRVALSQTGSMEAQLLASQQMVEWLEQQNADLRAKAANTQSFAGAMRRWSVTRKANAGTCCCAAPLTAWLSKRRG